MGSIRRVNSLREGAGTPLSFNELPADQFGIVILGAGGEISEWAEGIANMLHELGISETPNVFSSYGVITGNVAGSQARTDAYFLFNPENKLNVGKLSMWRLQFGDCSWLDDFINNYAKDYAEDDYEEFGESELFINSKLSRIMEDCMKGCDKAMREADAETAEIETATFSKTKSVGSKSVTITANGKDMDDIHRMLQLAGLEQAPEAPLDPQPQAVEPEPELATFTVPDHDSDQEALKDDIRNRLKSAWKTYGDMREMGEEMVQEDGFDPED